MKTSRLETARECLAKSVNSNDPDTVGMTSLDFRLLFSNRIVEQSWSDRRVVWTCDAIGMLLLDVLEEDLDFDWSHPNAIERFKTLLAVAYVAAGDVLPASQRMF